MAGSVKITLLADNSASLETLAEHGLSMLIESGGRRVLFDTGQGKVFRHNLGALAITLAPLDAIVLSHGHYDHTGGLAEAIELGQPAVIFMHPDAASPKFASPRTGPFRSIGMPAASLEALLRFQGRIVHTRAPAEVVPGIWCTGEIPASSLADRSGRQFYLDGQGLRPDPLLDDQALVIETASGLVVAAGCAHAGVEDTLAHINRLSASKPVRALIGGLHLMDASPAVIASAAAAIQGAECAMLAPCHCTGMQAHAHLRHRFPDLYRDVAAGSMFTFEEP